MLFLENCVISSAISVSRKLDSADCKFSADVSKLAIVCSSLLSCSTFPTFSKVLAFPVALLLNAFCILLFLVFTALLVVLLLLSHVFPVLLVVLLLLSLGPTLKSLCLTF